MKNTKNVRDFIKSNRFISGVYQIQNNQNNQIYIGSSINIGRRISRHIVDLKKNKHHCKQLQTDFSQNGIENFTFSVLEYIDNHFLLLQKEQEYKNTIENKYNFTEEITELPEINEKNKIRFNHLIQKTDTCWLWNGGLRSSGYGWFSIKGKKFTAHRISFLLRYKKLLTDKILLHTCDNKKCVNPDHLIEGSHHSNHIDRCNKGRGNFIITFEDATKIRQFCLEHKDMYADDLIKLINTVLNIDIKKHNLFPILLNKIWIDSTWKPLKCKRVFGEDSHSSRLNWNIVNYLRDLYNTTDYTLDYLGECVKNKFNITIGFKVIHKIVKNQRWKDKNYIPTNKPYRKITTDIKQFILNSKLPIKQLIVEINQLFSLNLSKTSIFRIRKNINNNINLIIG